MNSFYDYIPELHQNKPDGMPTYSSPVLIKASREIGFMVFGISVFIVSSSLLALFLYQYNY